MKVHLLTTEQKDLLIGQQYTSDSIFNPTLDSNNDWFISIEEVDQCDNESYIWVKELPLINYSPVVIEDF